MWLFIITKYFAYNFGLLIMPAASKPLDNPSATPLTVLYNIFVQVLNGTIFLRTSDINWFIIIQSWLLKGKGVLLNKSLLSSKQWAGFQKIALFKLLKLFSREPTSISRGWPKPKLLWNLVFLYYYYIHIAISGVS